MKSSRFVLNFGGGRRTLHSIRNHQIVYAQRVRQIKNRLSAKRSRDSARNYVQELESMIMQMNAQASFFSRSNRIRKFENACIDLPSVELFERSTNASRIILISMSDIVLYVRRLQQLEAENRALRSVRFDMPMDDSNYRPTASPKYSLPQVHQDAEVGDCPFGSDATKSCEVNEPAALKMPSLQVCFFLR